MSQLGSVASLCASDSPPAAPGPRLDSWRQIILTGNLPKRRRLDAVSRWLLIARAC
jgi:hypothetical protein